MEENIRRINELARKAKTVGLTEEERNERERLRRQYLDDFRSALRAQLDAICYADDAGKKKR